MCIVSLKKNTEMSLREYTKLQKKETKKEMRNRTSNPYEIATRKVPVTRSSVDDQRLRDMSAKAMAEKLEEQQMDMSYYRVHALINQETNWTDTHFGSSDKPLRRSIRVGKDLPTGTDRAPGKIHFCHLLTKQATKLFEKYVCVFSEGRYRDIEYKDHENAPKAVLGGIFSTGVFGKCQYSEKPVVIKVGSPGHIAVAIYWTKANVVEFWDTAKFQTSYYPLLEETLCGFIKKDFYVSETPKFIDLTPNGRLQESTSDMDDNFCQTWIWFWVFIRTVLKCDAYNVNDWLLSLDKSQRLQMIIDFWHELSVGEYPRVTKEAVRDVCISFGLSDI